MWKTWKYHGTAFLALKTRDGDWVIFDEAGNHYGAFRGLPKPEEIVKRYGPIGKVSCLCPIVHER